MNVISQFPSPFDLNREQCFQAMFDGAAIGIGICGLDGQIIEANPALSRMLGYSQRELVETHAWELYPQVRNDAIRGEADGENSKTFSAANLGEQTSAKVLPVEPVPLEAAPIEALPIEARLGERLVAELLRGERGALEIEKRYRRKDGSELWGHLTVSLGVDARRKPAYLIAMLVDATERKQVDEHLRAAEKMEVIGRLAGGIAHDFNNLLTGILLYCDLLLAGLKSEADEKNTIGERGDNVPERRELCQHVEEVRMAGEQGAALTQQLLAIARKQAAEPRPIQINDVVASTENLLRRLIGEQVELVIGSDSGLDAEASCSLVLIDPVQFRQILMNLVLNARDALPQGGRISLNTGAAEFPDDVLDESSRGNGESGNYRRAVSLVVADNGCGMSEETRARLFEPFFTTKKPGEGTGLGLATVQRIVSEAGGLIEVRSEVGRGTCVEVFLPAIESDGGLGSVKPADVKMAASTLPASNLPPIPRTAQQSSAQEAGGTRSREFNKTILLVDDHVPARKSMQRILLDAGYRILSASSGKHALQLFAEHAEAPDLLIADCLMPGMNGQELAQMLLQQKPGLKVLLISGYHDAAVGSALAEVEMIRKPFSGRALIERVVEVMDRHVS